MTVNILCLVLSTEGTVEEDIKFELEVFPFSA